jgi:hypothetical protein
MVVEVRMARSPQDRTRIQTEAVRRLGQAVVPAATEATEAVLPREAMAWVLQAQAPAPAAPEAAVPAAGAAVRANDRYVLYAKGCCPKSVPFVLSSNFH